LLLFGKKNKLTGHKIFTFFFFSLHAHNTNQQLYIRFYIDKKKYQPTPTYIFTYAKKRISIEYIFTYSKKQYQ
jgi:hypothetical protein